MRNGREIFPKLFSALRNVTKRKVTLPLVAIALAAGVAMGGGVVASASGQAHYTASVRADDLGWDGSAS